jgi:hypothetical protein
MFNPCVGRFMDSGDVDERYYMHCTMKVKIFFALHHFMSAGSLRMTSTAKSILILLSVETDNYSHILNWFFSMIRGLDRRRIPKVSIHGATFP